MYVKQDLWSRLSAIPKWKKKTHILREKVKCDEYFAYISSFIYAMAAIGQLLSSS